MRTLALLIGGAALTAIGGAAAYYLGERNTEEPEYSLLREEGDFSLREYPRLVVAEVSHNGAREAALGRGFQRLAAYIFAKERKGEKIAMTAPVLQDSAGAAGWRTRFVMPASKTMGSLPSPPSDITLTELRERRMAVVRFAGNADSAALATRERDLRDWMAREKLSSAGPVEYAFYNSPFVPGPLRRNEVMIPIAGS